MINATGVLVHTNLGRAPLSAAAIEAVRAAAGCTDVEFDLESGKRGRRGAGALRALARAVPAAGAVLAAIDALGVRHGVLVVTRADLADPGPASRQAAGKIAATSLGGLETVAVSALTGHGLPELTAALGRLAARLPQPDPRGGVRLWLDRVFAIKGSGTVVTGTLQAGTVRAGDELTATPPCARCGSGAWSRSARRRLRSAASPGWR